MTGQTAAGYLYLGPTATGTPASSTLNFPLGDNRANGVTVALSGSGTLSVTYVAHAGATTHAIFDVTGYYVADATGAPTWPLDPGPAPRHPGRQRRCPGRSTSNAARTFQVPGCGGVPPNAIAVTGNLTVTGQTAAGYLFAGPTATQPRQLDPQLPAWRQPRQRGHGRAVGPGALSITYVTGSSGRTAQAILDITGYFTP